MADLVQHLPSHCRECAFSDMRIPSPAGCVTPPHTRRPY